MYGRNSVLIFVFCLLLGISLSLAAQIKHCSLGSRCIRIQSCPLMVRLVQSGTPENIRRVRNAICGFQGKRSMVCCPLAENETPPTTTTESQPLQLGNNLLPGPEICGRPSADDRIVGGAPAPIGGYPWVAAMGYEEPGVRDIRYLCSGTIINSKYIVTAAHCVNREDLGRKKLAVINLGDWDLSTSVDCQKAQLGNICASAHVEAGYEEIVIHPEYNSRGKSSDDIALVRLNITLDFSVDGNKALVGPICLPESSVDVRTYLGRNAVAAGWGLTEHGNYSNILLRVNVPVVNDSLCQQRYESDYVGKQLCVGGEGGQDTCSGDSGGGLILPKKIGTPFTLIGIVSFGSFPCGIKRFPGVYTSVADYRDWIVQNLQP